MSDKRKLFRGDKVVITQGMFEGCEGIVAWVNGWDCSVAVEPLYPWPKRRGSCNALYEAGTHEVGLVLEEGEPK